MSSFIGHSLTAGAIFLTGGQCPQKGRELLSIKELAWLGCLGIAAVAPDLDYFIPFLDRSKFGGLRISNSILYSLIFPAMVIGGLFLARLQTAEFRLRSIQIIIAGLSHILLDYLVGVYHSPLFWPITHETYASPVGLLPSAGKLSLTNYYFYRNLAIELGVLLPIYTVINLFIWRANKRWLLTIPLLAISATCITIAIGLTRA